MSTNSDNAAKPEPAGPAGGAAPAGAGGGAGYSETMFAVMRGGRFYSEPFTSFVRAKEFSATADGATVVPVLVTVLADGGGEGAAPVTGNRDVANDLHRQVMNVPCDPAKTPPTGDPLSATVQLAYRLGHREARHAIAELIVGHEGLRQLGERLAAAERAADEARGRAERLRKKLERIDDVLINCDGTDWPGTLRAVSEASGTALAGTEREDGKE